MVQEDDGRCPGLRTQPGREDTFEGRAGKSQDDEQDDQSPENEEKKLAQPHLPHFLALQQFEKIKRREWDGPDLLTAEQMDKQWNGSGPQGYKKYGMKESHECLSQAAGGMPD